MTETINAAKTASTASSKQTFFNETSEKNLALIISLLPLCVFSVASSSFHSLLVIFVSVVWCVIFEAVSQKILKQKIQVSDLSAAALGIIFALILPKEIELWQVLLGALVAVVAAKVFFGGNGSYVFSPALIGRAFLFVSFNNEFSDGKWLFPCGNEAQAVWVLALISLAFLYLVFMKVISPESPAAYLAVVLAACILYSLFAGSSFISATADFVTGGAVLFMAVFIISDPTILPEATAGKILYGAGAAVLTFIIMVLGNNQDGAMFAILIMNALAPYFNRKKNAKILAAAKAGGSK